MGYGNARWQGNGVKVRAAGGSAGLGYAQAGGCEAINAQRTVGARLQDGEGAARLVSERYIPARAVLRD